MVSVVRNKYFDAMGFNIINNDLDNENSIG